VRRIPVIAVIALVLGSASASAIAGPVQTRATTGLISHKALPGGAAVDTYRDAAGNLTVVSGAAGSTPQLSKVTVTRDASGKVVGGSATAGVSTPSINKNDPQAVSKAVAAMSKRSVYSEALAVSGDPKFAATVAANAHQPASTTARHWRLRPSHMGRSSAMPASRPMATRTTPMGTSARCGR